MTGHLATALRRAAQALRLAADLLDPVEQRLTRWDSVERLAPEVGWRRHGARVHAPRLR